jgi:3-dehydroquinate synthase
VVERPADKPFRVPHTLVLLFGMIVLAWGLTLVLPPGEFERVTNEVGREQVIPGSYTPLEGVERLPPKFGKNLVGSFYQPSEVLIDTDVLATLPRRELTAGLCEAIKQGAIGGKSLFSKTATFVEKLAEVSFKDLIKNDDLRAELSEVLAEQVRFKAKIVAGDERESVLSTDAKSRKILNFGHTFAHALEKVTNYRYLKHGEAVGYGILFAAELSKKLELLDNNTVNLLNDVVHRVGILPPIGHIAPEDVFDAFRFDKKLVGENLHWILLKGIGQPIIVPQNEIQRRLIRTVTKSFIRTKNS